MSKTFDFKAAIGNGKVTIDEVILVLSDGTYLVIAADDNELFLVKTENTYRGIKTLEKEITL